MAYEATIFNYSRSLSASWLRAVQRLREARTKLADGTYGADDLARAVAGSWLDTLDVASSLLPASDSLPVVALDTERSRSLGGVLHARAEARGSAFLEGLAPTSTLTCTVLARMGGTETIPGPRAVTFAGAEPITVAIDPSSLAKVVVSVAYDESAAIAAGVYQGFVYAGGKPIAMILLNLY
jgi:hypothetical protein